MESFERILRQGISTIEIKNGRQVTLDSSSLERIRELKRATPLARWVRLAGHIDAIRHRLSIS